MPVEFHFAGTLIPELSPKVKSHSVIHGEISDPAGMASLLSASDIAILTSGYEGFPMFIKESMAHGCIPLVTALPGNLTHLKDGHNSLLIYEIHDETALVKEGIDKINRLIGNRDLCKQLSKDAYQYAKTHFSRQSFNKSYRELLMPS